MDALNGLGGVYLEEAQVARGRNQEERARELLERAAQAFGTAEVASSGTGRRGIVSSNRGEVELLLGEIELERGESARAREHLNRAEEAFRPALSSSDEYPFGQVGLGRVFRAMALTDRSEGAGTRALESLRRAEDRFSRVIEAHPDLAEAYYWTGRVFEDRGGSEARSAALDYYQRAVRSRSKYPLPYFRLGALVEDEDPALASEYSRSFLRLQPKIFGEGRKADEARKRTLIIVPDLRGLNQDSARRALLRSGFRPGDTSLRTASARPGTVIDQLPKRGSKLPGGSPVNLVLAAPGGPLRVPDVEGKPRQEAEDAIRRIGFRVGKITRKKSKKTPGTVLDQDPEPGKEKKAGSKVDLEIAAAEMRVPRLEGLNVQEALLRIEEGGFKLGQQTARESSRPTGTVIDQKPDAGKKKLRGAEISIFVATPKPVKVPNLVGKNLENAYSEIRKKRLAIGAVTEQVRCRDIGRIIQSEPTPKAPR